MNRIIIGIVISVFVIAFASIFLRSEPLFVPQTTKIDVLHNMSSTTDHARVIKLIQDAGITSALESATVFTVFAPTDQAFAELPSKTLSQLANDNHQAIYTANNHLVLGNYPTASFNDGMILTTVNAEQIKITKRNNKWYVNNAEIVEPDIQSKNGVVHGINKVLLPKT